MSFLDLIFPKKCLECGRKGKYICQICLKELTGVAPVNSVWPYQGVIRKAILALKYRYASDVAEELAELIYLRLKTKDLRMPNDSILVPIPLHPNREKYRGFNQSAEVGKLLAKKMNWHYLPNLLIRKVPTPSQTGLNKSGRQKNIHGAFILNLVPNYLVPGASPIILFDDVYTTGSTMNEAKKVLHEAGFKKIYCLAIAG